MVTLKKDNVTLRIFLILFTVIFLTLMLILPLWAIFIEAFKKGYMMFFSELFSQTVLNAMWLSTVIVVSSVFFSTLFGICAAWCIVYFRFPGRKILVSVIDLPVSISPIIVGLMFMTIYGKYEVVGSYFEMLGFSIIFSWPGLLLTNMSITLPYVVRSLIPAMEELGTQQEQAAHLLGARGFTILWRITLPRVKWALLYGIILATARSAGEFGAASVVSGFIRNKTVTLPLQVHIFYSEYLSTSAFITATLFVLFALVTLVAKGLVEKQAKQSIKRALS